MKIRQGFVSNSSSSSFIVAFPNKPKTKKDILKYMFKGKKDLIFTAESYYSGTEFPLKYTSSDIANQLFLDLEKESIINIDKLANRFYERYYFNQYKDSYDLDGNSMYGWMKSDSDKKWFGIDKQSLDKLEKLNVEFREYEEHMHELIYKKKSKKLQNELSKKQTEFYENVSELTNIIAKIDATTFFNDNSNGYITAYEYGYNHGMCQSELGGLLENDRSIWKNVPHIYISRH